MTVVSFNLLNVFIFITYSFQCVFILCSQNVVFLTHYLKSYMCLFQRNKIYYKTLLGKNIYYQDLYKKKYLLSPFFFLQKHMQHHLIQIHTKIIENCNIPSFLPLQMHLFSIFKKAKANKLNLLYIGKSKRNQ